MIHGVLQGIGAVQGTLAPIGRLDGALADHGHMSCTLQAPESITAVLSGLMNMTAELTLPKGKASPPFTGAYTYTPTQETQTIPIDGLKAIQDITIEPIPSNYGLITWNGSTITVS